MRKLKRLRVGNSKMKTKALSPTVIQMSFQAQLVRLYIKTAFNQNPQNEPSHIARNMPDY